MSDPTRKATRLLRLPEGGVTEDMEAYVKAWFDLGDFLESAFKGYRVFGYDPDFIMTCPTSPHKSLTVNVHAAGALKRGFEEAQAAARAGKKRRKRGV